MDCGHEHIITRICTLRKNTIEQFPSKKYKWPRHCAWVFFLPNSYICYIDECVYSECIISFLTKRYLSPPIFVLR
jgi:hypothetical protein